MIFEEKTTAKAKGCINQYFPLHFFAFAVFRAVMF
jgi:hypothetical protein